MKSVILTRMLCCGVFTAVMVSSAFAQNASPGMAKELVATWERAASGIIGIAEAMPEDRYDFKPTPEVRTFAEQLVHVADVVQRFIDTAKGVKSESDAAHKTMQKAEVISLVKQRFQTAQEMLSSLSDAQVVEPVKFPFGNRMVSRYGYWMGALQAVYDHYGQLIVYLRLNHIVPPATAQRQRSR